MRRGAWRRRAPGLARGGRATARRRLVVGNGALPKDEDAKSKRKETPPPLSWTEEVYGRKAFRPEEKEQETAVEPQTLSLDVGAACYEEEESGNRLGDGELATTSTAGDGDVEGKPDLPEVTRFQVFTACLGTSGIFVFLAGFLRSYASQHGAPEVLLTDPQGLDLQSGLLVLASSLLVTSARVQLLERNADFAEATQRSNKQILSPLKAYDFVWLAFLTGISEEALFRGALLPATTFDDWRGVLITAAVFGYFHRSGGRNWVFALWSTWVGAIYGGAFLLSHNLLVPMVSHSLSNLVSAGIWKGKEKQQQQQQQ
ncbi:hypothetical protein HOP50_20g85010 [Chloropicon primus]|uniref:CAAX prenyl protease 2/Lysostaphin resistance protein A-like domain-containing protein n=1 Tax=Chloropicon primus TaxID=1764295 RepID=A0A5B8N1G5_9CHLO|nr:hypothetical protein A3770_20p84700 [Chloropicon primus]UPR05153.1 hypothetical protein HOP50_20g85010 [Chloropicon primus]|eukprot:QDZ25952.1 hypothetical protein A3770_20p84700 [Chloropicon primus]